MNNNQLINKALQYISKEWSHEQLSLEKVANAAGFSLSYFDRLFNSNVGRPVMEYVRSYKLIRSAQILRTSDKGILDIALELGYANPESYTRAFKELYKMPPSEYREKHKNEKLTWKDLSTGSVIKQFESQVPDLRRVDVDEAMDFIIVNNPLFYLGELFMLTQTDNAVYTLNDDNLQDFVIVHEYRPEEVTLEIVCQDVNRLRSYLNIAKKFNNVFTGFICDADFKTPEDEFGLLHYKKNEYFNYIYLNDAAVVPQIDGYMVRSLEVTDGDSVKKLATITDKSVPLTYIFKQKFEFNNYPDIETLGLFYNNSLVGCALPDLLTVRGLSFSDIGSIVIAEQNKTKETLKLLWASAIQYAIEKNAKPVSFTTASTSKLINTVTTEKMGYSLISKKIAYTNIQR